PFHHRAELTPTRLAPTKSGLADLPLSGSFRGSLLARSNRLVPSCSNITSVISAQRARLRPARESRNPVNYARRVTLRPSFTESRLALARPSRARLAGTTAISDSPESFQGEMTCIQGVAPKREANGSSLGRSDNGIPSHTKSHVEEVLMRR